MERREERGRYKRDRRGLVGCSQEFSVSQTAWPKLDFHHCGESDSVRIFKWLLMSGSGRAFSLSPRLRAQLCSRPRRAVSNGRRWVGDSGPVLHSRSGFLALVLLLPTCLQKLRAAGRGGKAKTRAYYMTDLQGATKGRKCFVCFMVITGN